MIPLNFNEADSERAFNEWKATCGPHAIAAVSGMTLDQVRPKIPNYRGWMNPTQVSETLAGLGLSFVLKKNLRTMKLCNGVNRVQWEGPWLNPGVPKAAAYRHTHLVAQWNGFVLCTACLHAEWIREVDWRNHLLRVEPVQPFHITHHWVIEP